MNELTYLSVVNELDKVSVVIFKGKRLHFFEEIYLFENNYLKSIYEYLNEQVIRHDVNMIITNDINVVQTNKKNIIQITERQTLYKLVAQTNNILYSTFRTYGWEKRLLLGNTTNKQKVSFINSMYMLNLKTHQVGIANAIILAEGVAHNRLQIGGT